MRLYQIDAFTDQPFRGNPAAVCLLDRERDAAWMQQVAAEMNLSETAFLLRRGDAWSLRWFTPAVEVDLCGHATLASAHALFQEQLADGTIAFDTRSGRLTARRSGDWIELDFPSTPAVAAELPDDVIRSVGVEPVFTGRNQFDYLIEAADESAVRSMRPDFAALRSLGARGVIVTSRASEYDFVSRFLAGGVGIDEDPVTGSAHCTLAPYWAAKLGKQEFVAFQASPRGGVLRVRLAGDRVLLGGRAVTVFSGELLA